MSQPINMKDAEKQVFRLAIFDDGIWEIYLGLFFTLMSTFSVTRDWLGPAVNAGFIIGVSLLLVRATWVAKRRFTLPRTGLVRLGQNSKRKIRNANLIVWALVIATFGLLILSAKNWIIEPSWDKLPQWVTDFDVDLVFALALLAFFSGVAYVVGLPRFYLYGVLLGVGNFVSTVLLVYQGLKFQWPLAIAGGVVIASGMWVLVKFLRDYPIPAQESANAG